MKKLIIIVGSTASGKSSLALKIAKDFNLSIINADAFQVYKELNAGINKPTIQELKEVKHFFINSKSIYDEWHLKKFKDEAYELIDNSKENVFVVCGGSNLYIDSIIKNYHLVDVDETLEYINFTNEQLYEKLKKKTKFNTVTKTESSVFNENYNIYVDDVFDSAKILSPSFISHLTDFINMYKCSVNILAKGLRIYVAVNNYNYFNFALMHKVDSLCVEQFRLELLMAYYLAKVFKYDFNA